VREQKSISSSIQFRPALRGIEIEKRNSFMDYQLQKLPDVLAKTGLSRAHLYALAQKGAFPKPVKLSERSSAWVESEVQDWINERIAARGQEALNEKRH
jgi:prophage regulatory protein